tara:strand:+ start:16025 stop:16702 length:678 start_codon:yes stop_codon:yes gene_type:complete
MSTLKLKGSTSGEAEITVTAAAGTPTITLPTASINLATAGSDGQYLKTNGSGTLSFDTPTNDSGQIVYKGTAVATTSGTSVEFTGIPSTATRLTLIWADVSGSSTEDFKIQLGHSGGYYTSNYKSTSGYQAEGVGYSENGRTDSFVFFNGGAAHQFSMMMTFMKLNNTSTGTSWVQRHNGTERDQSQRWGGGVLNSVSTAVDRLKVTFTGDDTFDGGSMNLTWEL